VATQPACATLPDGVVAGQPEVHQYRMCFWDHSEPTNDWSDIASVTVGP
jgi:hypothetical protein